MTTFRQLIIGAAAGDAITGMSRHLAAGLAHRGRSELYAHHIAPELAGEFGRLADLPPGRSDDVLIYHASYGEPEVTRVLLDRPERLVLVYHNLTPSQYFVRSEPAVAAALEWGRHELGLLRDRVDLAVAVSAFNAADLERYGYGDVASVPVGLDVMRLHDAAADTAVADELAARFPAGYVLWVSQLLPHKRAELAVAARHLLQWVLGSELGLVVAGVARAPAYGRALHTYTRRLQLDRVWFPGRVSDGALATLFRQATMFCSTSAHEGLALPPLEAMSFGLPVVTAAVGALPETVDDAGLVLPADAGPVLFAEALAMVDGDRRLQLDLGERGMRRARDLRAADPSARFVELLEQRGVR